MSLRGRSDTLREEMEKDASDAIATTCNAEAAEKKLAGAAKTSFTTKSVKDSTAAAK